MSLKTKIVAGAAVALMLAGAGAAVAASGGGAASHGAKAHARPGPGPGHPGPAGDLQAAADYLGVPLATLRGELRSGKTLADVAGATSSKSVDGLVAALVASAKTHIEAAVTAGRLTRAQADRLESGLQEHVADLVNHAPPARGPGRGPRGHGPGDCGPGGPPPGGPPPGGGANA
ncbi:MAG TPA: hypothetical protein VFJ77_08570 [Gaiellaceae bacterium]|nr:hypothetical protein [Gaiellaceae bacterium]